MSEKLSDKIHLNGFVKQDRYIMKNIYPQLKPASRNVYSYFLNNHYSYANPVTKIRVGTIAKNTNLSEKSVRSSIQVIEKMGLLERTKTPGRPDNFTLKFPWLDNLNQNNTLTKDTNIPQKTPNENTYPNSKTVSVPNSAQFSYTNKISATTEILLAELLSETTTNYQKLMTAHIALLNEKNKFNEEKICKQQEVIDQLLAKSKFTGGIENNNTNNICSNSLYTSAPEQYAQANYPGNYPGKNEVVTPVISTTAPVKITGHIIELVLNKNLNKTTTTLTQTRKIEDTQESSSGQNFDNSKKIDEKINLIDITPLAQFYLTHAKLRPILLADKLSVEEIQNSIDAFAFDLVQNQRIKKIDNPCSYFLKTLEKGYTFHFPKNYRPKEKIKEEAELQNKVIVSAEEEKRKREMLKEIQRKVEEKIEYLTTNRPQEIEELDKIAYLKAVEEENQNNPGDGLMKNHLIEMKKNLILKELVEERYFSNLNNLNNLSNMGAIGHVPLKFSWPRRI